MRKCGLDANKTRHRSPRLDKPFKLTICVTQTCAMDCKLCYADCGAHPAGELTTEQWKALIDQLIAEDFLHVLFEGGEPFQRPDFEDLLAYCRRRFYIAIRTHATTIDNARAERLKPLGVGRLYVDLFAAEPEVHDELTGTPGSFAAALRGISAARDAGIQVTILGILSRKNHLHLQRYIDLAAECDCDQVGILRLYPLGRAKRNWPELALSLDEMSAALVRLTVPANIELMQSWHPRNGNCCWQSAAVSPQGESIGCPYLREYVSFGSILDRPFIETWDHPLYRELRSNAVEAACSDCAITQGTYGGCRATAYAFNGRWNAADPFCPHTNEGVDLRALPQRLLCEGA